MGLSLIQRHQWCCSIRRSRLEFLNKSPNPQHLWLAIMMIPLKFLVTWLFSPAYALSQHSLWHKLWPKSNSVIWWQLTAISSECLSWCSKESPKKNAIASRSMWVASFCVLKYSPHDNARFPMEYVWPTACIAVTDLLWSYACTRPTVFGGVIPSKLQGQSIWYVNHFNGF